MSVAQQAEEVYKVKRSANGIIDDPVTLPPDVPVSEARESMELSLRWAKRSLPTDPASCEQLPAGTVESPSEGL